MADKKKVLLIDVFGLMYKFFYTLPPMTAADGKPTNAIYGLTRVLLKLMRESGADYIIPALESRIPTFRHDMFADYKGHREKMPDKLREQIPGIDNILAALNMKAAQADGFEADDLIGTFSRVASERGFDVDIITGDRDMLQLVDDRVRVLMSKKGTSDLEFFDSEKVRETMGVPPERVVDFKALAGDSSDNIPGVPQVGEKTALSLLAKFDSLDNIYANLDAIDKPKLRSSLADNRDLAELSRKLATINREVPFDAPFDDFSIKEPDRRALAEFLSKYAFRSLIRELNLVEELATPKEMSTPGLFSHADGEQSPATPPAGRFRMILKDNEGELIELLEKAKAAKILCIDVETTGLDTIQDDIVGYSVAVEPGDAFYIPVRHEPPPATSAQSPDGDIFSHHEEVIVDTAAADLCARQLSPERAIEILKPYFEDPSIGKYGHNLKFDYLMLRSAGMRMRNIEFDSILASYLLSPDTRGHSLKNVAGHMLGAHFKTYQDICGTGKKQISFTEVPLDIATEYAANDVDAVLRIQAQLKENLAEQELTEIFNKIEVPLIEVLAEMEFNGVAIDSLLLKELSIRMTRKEAEIVVRVHEMTGREINLNSPKQVADLLFNYLGLPPIKKQSTDISVLEELRNIHEVVPLLIDYRQLSKLRGTYIDALPALVKIKTGRIHTNYNQTIAATGRLSSSDPNLQNIPIRSEAGKEIRKAFIAPGKDNLIISADYSQVEIRLLAHFTGDENLINAFKNGEDIHTRTASDVFGVPLEEVTSDQRRYAKTINFGIIYGMREFKLSNQLGISRREAADFIDNYFARYPTVREFIDETIRRVQLDGYVTTLFGRRRYFPEINSGNRNEREAAHRAAVNTRIQGTAADIMKLAMLKVHSAIQQDEIPAKMILQVHDELVFEVESRNLRAAAEKIKYLMENCVPPETALRVPLPADVSAGPNWLDTEPVVF